MADKFLGANAVLVGATNVSLGVVLRSMTDYSGKTGVAYGDITAYYWRQGGSNTSIAASALGSITAAHTDGGWYELDSTNSPGVYRFDLPDAMFAAGADWVQVSIKVTNTYLYCERFAIPTNSVDQVVADTENIQDRIPAALTNDGNIKADSLRVSGSATAADNMETMYTSGIKFSTAKTGTLTTTSFSTNLTEADDVWNYAFVMFLDGNAAGQSRIIEDYANTNGVITITNALTTAPADGDSFMILGGSK